MEHTQVTQSKLAAYLADLQRWCGAAETLPRDLRVKMLSAPRLSFDDFRAQAPAADPVWLAGLWLARGVGDTVHCHASLAGRFQQLQLLWLELSAADHTFSLFARQSWFSAWDRFLFHLQTWYPGLGSAGDKFLQRCDHVLQHLQSRDPATCQSVLEAFNRQADRDLERAARVATRIRDTEMGQIKVQEARRQVETALNQWLAGCSLPDGVFDYIRHTLAPALQYYLINQQTREWALWSELLQGICRLFDAGKSVQELASLHRQASSVTARLQAINPPQGCELQGYHQFIHDILDGIDRLMAGKGLEASIAPPVTSSRSTGQVRSHRRDQETHALNCGDWFLFAGQGAGEVRCQYLLQSPASGALIFVNRLGHKVVQMSVGRLLEARERREVQPIARVRVYSTAANKTAARLEYCHAEARLQWQQQEKIRQQRLAQQAREQAGRERAIAARRQADKAARAKAMAEEMARLQQLKREREAAEQEARQALLAERRKAAEARIETLTLGMMADIARNDKSRERCTLGMIMPSTGKYLFFDQYQRKVHEWRRDELLQQILAGNIEFYEAEPGFDSRLEQIVFGQRRT